METILFKFLKFGIVGGGGIVIDMALTYLFKEKLRTNKYLANAIGFKCAASSNYFLNRIWTFDSHNPDISSEYLDFVGVSIMGLIINSVVIWLLHSQYKKNFYFSKLMAIGVTIVWNFSVNYMFTFNQ